MLTIHREGGARSIQLLTTRQVREEQEKREEHSGRSGKSIALLILHAIQQCPSRNLLPTLTAAATMGYEPAQALHLAS